MHSIRTNFILRTVMVAVTLMGWFVLSNHCALGRMVQTAQAQKEHACCPNGQSEPANGDQRVQCCKSLHAVVPDGVKAASLTPPEFVVAVLLPLVALEDHIGEAVVLASETGPPPRAASFSELVLHRSLRSHAPPFFT